MPTLLPLPPCLFVSLVLVLCWSYVFVLRPSDASPGCKWVFCEVKKGERKRRGQRKGYEMQTRVSG
ncbi:hypothetical protein COCC4DRAFT_31098, partial [Bipolaris maydis ATCC 48331]